MDNKNRSEVNANLRRTPSQEPVKGSKIAGEERNMQAISDISSLNDTQRPVSIVGWTFAFIVGAAIWAAIFYVI
jgi:hypothetical protein